MRKVRLHQAAAGVLTIAAASMLAGTATASADPPPNCTAADLAGVASGVSAATSAYLFTHPDVNAFFTSLKGRTTRDTRADVANYLNANPQVKAELTGIRQPLIDLKQRCG